MRAECLGMVTEELRRAGRPVPVPPDEGQSARAQQKGDGRVPGRQEASHRDQVAPETVPGEQRQELSVDRVCVADQQDDPRPP